GIGRSGSIAGHGSGDIFLAFSTANADAHSSGEGLAQASFIPIERMNPLFDAVIQSVDEAVLNAMVANETMTGADDHVIDALPHDEVREILGKHGRLVDV
ncbi:MAG: P1 family peptidase, partial [Pseudomonadales bacterium]